MDDMRVAVDKIREVSDQLAQSNEKLKSQADSIQKKMQNMGTYWNSPAGNNMLDHVRDVGRCSGAYYEMIKNVVVFLKGQVGEGYTVTEKENTSLADAFK